MKIFKSKFVAVFLGITANICYCFIGWFAFILFDITSPDDPKFDLDPLIRSTVFPVILLLHIFGEIVFMNKAYTKLFSENKRNFIFFLAINILIYFLPLLVGLIEIAFF